MCDTTPITMSILPEFTRRWLYYTAVAGVLRCHRVLPMLWINSVAALVAAVAGVFIDPSNRSALLNAPLPHVVMQVVAHVAPAVLLMQPAMDVVRARGPPIFMSAITMIVHAACAAPCREEPGLQQAWCAGSGVASVQAKVWAVVGASYIASCAALMLVSGQRRMPMPRFSRSSAE
jgi:hypothetical protein